MLGEHIDTVLMKKLDSLKQTQRPNGSNVKVMFKRDIDFGYQHKRINIVFNAIGFYQLNMLVKNDTVCFASLIFGSEMGEIGGYDGFIRRHSIPYIDSTKALHYVQARNQFYHSGKTLNDLKNELAINSIYALRGGDQYEETWDKLHIDTLVLRKDYVQLESMLKSINCETQMYAFRGLTMLKKKHGKLPGNDQEIIDYIIRRNTELESTAGDIGPIIWKAFK